MIDFLLPFRVFYMTQEILFSQSIWLGLIADTFFMGLIFIAFDNNGDFVLIMDKILKTGGQSK